MCSNFWVCVTIIVGLLLGFPKWRGHWHCWQGKIRLLFGVMLSRKRLQIWRGFCVLLLCWKFLILNCPPGWCVTHPISASGVYLNSLPLPENGILWSTTPKSSPLVSATTQQLTVSMLPFVNVLNVGAIFWLVSSFWSWQIMSLWRTYSEVRLFQGVMPDDWSSYPNLTSPLSTSRAAKMWWRTRCHVFQVLKRFMGIWFVVCCVLWVFCMWMMGVLTWRLMWMLTCHVLEFWVCLRMIVFYVSWKLSSSNVRVVGSEV